MKNTFQTAVEKFSIQKEHYPLKVKTSKQRERMCNGAMNLQIKNSTMNQSAVEASLAGIEHVSPITSKANSRSTATLVYSATVLP